MTSVETTTTIDDNILYLIFPGKPRRYAAAAALQLRVCRGFADSSCFAPYLGQALERK
jgi:hypothetical protein